MAVQSKLPDVSNFSKQSYSSGTLKLKPFDLKKINQTIASASPLILPIAKKPTGKSWIIKDILNNNNLSNPANAINVSKLVEINELANLINTKLHL